MYKTRVSVNFTTNNSKHFPFFLNIFHKLYLCFTSKSYILVESDKILAKL
jgi:hypothetical protein